MALPSLPSSAVMAGVLPALRGDQPTLRVDVRTNRITEASPALAALLECHLSELVDRPLADLWLPAERRAILSRFDDVLLLGQDTFGALALVRARGGPVWVEVDAHYAYHGGQRLELVLTRLRRPSAELALPIQANGDTASSAGADRRWPATTVTRPTTLANAARSGLEGNLMIALDAAGVAALAIGRDGTVTAATHEAEPLFHLPVGCLRGLALVGLLDLPRAAAEALAAARRAGTRQTVLAEYRAGEEQLVVEWVPGVDAGAGCAILVPNAPGSEASERLRFQAGLVSFVAHDLRDALASMVSGLHILADELPGDSPLQSTVDRALREGRLATRIVDDVLAVSRPGRLARVELDLAAVLRESILRFRQRAMARGIQLREALVPGVRVSADLSGLERAFGNIIENALQAMTREGTLTLSMGLQDRARPGVLLAIADTGPGINPEIRTDIFEPFVTDKQGGTGLGLAIARRVVVDHGGQLDFDSEPGAGTTFFVWLPRLT